MDVRISSATHMGNRSYQEDRIVIRRVDAPQFGIVLAVADGHGGDQTSSFVAQQLSEGLFDKMLKENTVFNVALMKTYQILDSLTLDLSKKNNVHSESGSTLSTVYVPDGQNRLHIGIIGDSPVILAKRSGKFSISPEHNARSNRQERMDAESRGGLYKDGYIYSQFSEMGLQMTRDIGCHAMGGVLKRYPDVLDWSIEQGDVVIVGSDGLLDPSHGTNLEQAERLVKMVLEGADAQALIDDAIERRTEDNTSAIVYRH